MSSLELLYNYSIPRTEYCCGDNNIRFTVSNATRGTTIFDNWLDEPNVGYQTDTSISVDTPIGDEISIMLSMSTSGQGAGISNFKYHMDSIAIVPEPATYTFFFVGFTLLAVRVIRKKREYKIHGKVFTNV